jgi:hypothetical protein
MASKTRAVLATRHDPRPGVHRLRLAGGRAGAGGGFFLADFTKLSEAGARAGAAGQASDRVPDRGRRLR